MICSKRMMVGGMLAAVVLGAMGGGRAARAYVDLAPTLSKVVGETPTIAVVEVTAYDRDKHLVTLQPVTTLKGTLAPEPFSQEVAAPGGTAPRQIVQWAVPGSRAVVFQSRNATRGITLVCFGTGWYQVNAVGTGGGGAWKLGAERPDLPLAYYGSVSRLADAVQAMLKGQGAVITVVAFGADSEGASFDLALNRQSLPGVVRLQRLRANMNMPQSVMAASTNPAFFIGGGVVDEKDLPALLERMKSSDPGTRAEAAEDLRTLGRKARSGAPVLAGLLQDNTPRVRFAAASALLRVTPKNTQGLDVLLAGLADRNAQVRHFAAAAAGYSGPAGAALAEKLAALLRDPDEVVRLTALESISMLGPAAEKAVPALIPLLDDKDLVVDACDALGRIGPAASPALKKLTALLASDQAAVRWAAVRGMAQIGGAEAHPAVDFLVKAMPAATEVEGYNMMIYFSLLGPVAQDAAQAIQSFRIKNPMLPNSTLWAINPNRGLPWVNGGGGGGGGRGMGGFGGMGGPGGDMGTLMYSAYVRELGFRLRAMSPVLAQGIMNDTAGSVPVWGYDLLNAGPDLSLGILTPYLKNTELMLRERAAVAIGYMGEDGAPAKAAVEEALANAPTEREKKLLQWTLRQMEVD